MIDYTNEDFSKNAATYDLIFNVGGAATFDPCHNSLKTQKYPPCLHHGFD